MTLFDPLFVSAAMNVLVALLLGMTIGIERSIAHKTAGLRTYGLVSMGSALFIVTTTLLGQSLTGLDSADVSRIVAGVITGIGFLCAGEIIRREQSQKVVGLTTAAGLWVAAGVGIATGFGFYKLAIFATLLTLLTFTIFWSIEREVTEISDN